MARTKTVTPASTTTGATLPPPGSEKHLYLVDLSGYVFRAYHAIGSSKGEPTHAVMGTVNMLQKVVTGRRPHFFAVAMDSKGKTFRHELDERYKAQRPEPPADLSQQMRRCEEIVRAYNIPVYQVDGMEADDLIASVTKRALEAGIGVVIVSSDKDLMQLVHDDDERVVLWDSMRDKVFGPREVEEKWGVTPSHLHDLLALVGDTSDNIPGVPGVGPKTAADLLATHGTLEGVYANIASITKAKLKESLVTHEADARLSYQLVALRDDVPVAWDLAHLRYGEPDVAELQRLFTELEFTRLLEQWKVSTPVVRELATITTREQLLALAEEAKASNVLGIDLELTRPDAFQADIVGLSLSTSPGRGAYVPLSHRYLGVPKQLTFADIAELLGPVLASGDVTKVGHDLKSIELVLVRRGLPLAGPRFDTMLAGYILDPEASTALADDAQRELGAALPVFGARAPTAPKPKGPALEFDELEIERATPFAAAKAETVTALRARFQPRLESEGLGPLFRDVEMPLSTVLLEMERTGVLVDIAQLGVIGKRVDEELTLLESKAKTLAGRDFSIRSRDQLETILFDELELPVLKRTPKGGRSTDASVLDELAEQHELPRVINEYREIDKLKGTYIVARPELAEHPDPHGARPRDSQRVRGASGARDSLRRLFAGGAALARASLRRPEAARGVSLRGGRPRADGRAHLRRGSGSGDEGDAQPREDHQLRRDLRDGGRGARQADRSYTRGSGAVHRCLLRTLRWRSHVHGRDGREGASGGGGPHAPRASSLSPELALGEPWPAHGGRTHRQEHADSGNGRGPDEARDATARSADAGSPSATARREDAPDRARRARVRGPGRARGGGR